MSIVSFNRKKPCYAWMVGGATTSSAVTTQLLPFATTFIASNGITRNSATRVTFQEPGFYEIIVPFAASVVGSGTPVTYAIQTGLNGSFTTRVISTSAQNVVVFGTNQRFILEFNKGDYFEIRGLTSAAVGSHSVQAKSVALDGIFPTTTIKKLK